MYCDDELLISPGDLWDRITILEVKILNIEDPAKQEVAAEEWRKSQKLLAKIHEAGFIPQTGDGEPLWHPLVEFVDKLRKRNAIQWNTEDRVRVEESWEAAQEARNSNTQRVYIKNMINAIYGYCEDQKDYAAHTVQQDHWDVLK